MLTRSAFWIVSAVGLGFATSPVDAQAQQRPNILFCIADDASPHFGEAYGCQWAKTPNIDRLAKQGLVFDNTYTPTAKCAPSRAAILTGRYPWQLEDAANHQSIFPPKYTSFTEAFKAAGMHCGSFGKTWGPGTALTADGKPRDWGMPAQGKAKKKDGEGGPGGAFRSFLTAKPKDKPFFFWFGSHHPHRPYKLDAGIAAGKKPADIDRVPAFWPDNDVVRRDMLDYAIAIETFDSEVGSLVKALDASGEAENTLIIVTSDHGMPFPRSKGHNYEISNHVPLVACWPKGIANPGRRISPFVNFVDLTPTFLELEGLETAKSGMFPITGTSFTDLLRGKADHERPFVITGRERNDVNARPGTEAGLGYPVRAIREGDLLYIHNFTAERWPCGNPDLGLKDTDAGPTKKFAEDAGQKDRYWQFAFGKRPAEELYDVVKDPDCINNLAEDKAFRERMTALHDKLVAQLKKQEDPRILGKGDVFDNYPTSKKK